MGTSGYIRFFEEMGIDDVPLVGGKNASLGEMFQKLSDRGVRVPHGFAITGEAYRYMLDEAGAWERLHAELDDLDPADVGALARKAKRAREIVYGAGLPGDLAGEILAPYRKLRRPAGLVPQHQGRRESARHVPPLFCKSFHRSRDPLPNRPRLRPLQ